MSNAIYPGDLRGLTWTVLKTAEASTIVQASSSAVEMRIANYQNPKWHWILQYSLLYDRPQRLSPGYSTTEYRYLQGFFLARQGMFDDFLFDDPTDDSVGPAMLPGVGGPNLQAQLQVVNDGAGNYYSPIQRNFGGLFYEDVTDLNGGITLYDNGALQVLNTNYTLGGPGLAIPGASFAGLYAQWATQPAGPVTAQFNFFFRVRFETDSQDFEQFQSDLWAIGGDGGVKGSGELKLVSARRTSL